MFSSLVCSVPVEMEKEEVSLTEAGGPSAHLAHLGIVLPSNSTWRNDNYFRLVELHRRGGNNLPTKYKHIVSLEDQQGSITPCTKEEPLEKEIGSDTLLPITWTHEDLAFTSQLLTLSERSLADNALIGRNPEQVRRVYSLAFDILRFKPILQEALEDVEFLKNYRQFETYPWKVWILFYDLYRRDFLPRDVMDQKVFEFFKEEDLSDIDSALWSDKVQLAAAISRIRIKNGAHILEDMLSPHLQISQKLLHSPVIGGWINSFKIEKSEFFANLEKELQLECQEDKNCDSCFIKDHIVPRYIHCYNTNRENILNSDLVVKKHFIIQDKSLCLAAVMFLKVMEKLELCGSVAQTHLITPPSTAFFASMIANNPNIDQLLIFSTGPKKTEYEEYFQDIGAFNVSIFSEEFSNIAPENRVLHNVIAVMACPPCSNTGVVNPVDVAISRGGDFTVMYALTEHYKSENNDENISNVQRNTLLKAMSMPQIQAVLYETQSRSLVENSDMVNLVVNEINQWAADKHYEEHQGQQQQQPDMLNNQEFSETEEESPAVLEEIIVQVPLCDLYEVSCLPDMCPEEGECVKYSEEGVYLALLKRKEVTRLDPTYMINMAEARGLFGRQGDSVKVIKKKPTRTFSFSLKETVSRPRVEIDKLAAPTFASKYRDVKVDQKSMICERHFNHFNGEPAPVPSMARAWWKALLSHIKKYLHCKNKLPKLKLNRPITVTRTSPVKLNFPTRIATIDFCASMEYIE